MVGNGLVSAVFSSAAIAQWTLPNRRFERCRRKPDPRQLSAVGMKALRLAFYPGDGSLILSGRTSLEREAVSSRAHNPAFAGSIPALSTRLSDDSVGQVTAICKAEIVGLMPSRTTRVGHARGVQRFGFRPRLAHSRSHCTVCTERIVSTQPLRETSSVGRASGR
jgi:hypothetical protein